MIYTNQHNPVLPTKIHIPDSEAHVMSDGKLYLYGSFDDREGEYCSDRYYVVSTPDMKHWEITEETFQLSEIPWAFDNPKMYPGDIDWTHPSGFIMKMIEKLVKDLESQGINPMEYVPGEKELLLFAPDCIEKDGNYYLYFCLSDGREGVAVADSPVGPFGHPVQLPCGGIDPAIFIDDDGKAYYYWGQIHLRGVCLNEDMVSFEEENVVDNLLTEEEHFFHEGASVRKIGDTYYCVFTDVERGRPTALGYATSKSPLGPFTYRGIIIDNIGCDPKTWNNHGSIECMNGQWYVFYHRSSRNTEQHRRLCIEPIQIEADGTIREVKMTSQGVGKPFERNEEIMGYEACELKGGAYIGPAEGEGEEMLRNLTEGDKVIWRYVEIDEACKSIQAEASGNGRIEIMLDDMVLGSITVSNGAAVSGEMTFPEPGIYELKLVIQPASELCISKLVIR